MKQAPTLVQQLEQFLYTHAPNIPFKKNLLEVVATWERAYQARILELENELNQRAQYASEGGANTDDTEYNRWSAE